MPDDLQWALDEVESLRTSGERENARTLLQEVVDGELFAALLESDLGVVRFGLSAIDELAASLKMLQLQLEVREELHSRLEASLPADDLALVAAKMNLGQTRTETGDIEGGRELFEQVHDACERLLPPDDVNLLGVKLNLAVVRRLQGDLEGSLELEEQVLAIQTRTLPPDHPDLLVTRENLAVTRMDLGDLEGAHEMFQQVHDARERLLPADDEALLRAKLNLAATCKELGDLDTALELQEAVLAGWERLLPADHPDLLLARQAVATTLYRMGVLVGALPLMEQVYAARKRLLPPDHPDLLDTETILASMLGDAGQRERALELLEHVNEVKSRRLPEDHLDLLDTRLNLASARAAMGDLAGALVLEEQVHSACERLLPDDHPALLAAKQNLAVTRGDLGDLDGALELAEHVYEVRLRILPEGHPDLLASRLNLAVMLSDHGEHERAHGLFEEVYEDFASRLPEGHPDLLTARGNLAVSSMRLGRHELALELLESVRASLAEHLPPDHPDLLDAEQNLASACIRAGDVDRCDELLRDVYAARAGFLPEAHPELLDAAQNLAMFEAWLGEDAAARDLILTILEGQLARCEALRLESPRVARAAARHELGRLSWILSSPRVEESGDAARLDSLIFAVLESLRLVSTDSSEVALAAARHPELRELRDRLETVSGELNDLVASHPTDSAAIEDWRRKLVEVSARRDDLQREVLQMLHKDVGGFEAPTAAALARRIGSDSALVSYLRYERKPIGTATKPGGPSVGTLLACLVTSDGEVHRIDLGPVEPIERSALEWRAALGTPLDVRGDARGDARGRGLPTPGAPREAVVAGSELREQLFDPILDRAGTIDTLLVVADDLLHLVPLDALPLDGDVVGNRLHVRYESNLRRLLDPDPPLDGEPLLLAIGDIDYGARVTATDPFPTTTTPPAGSRTTAASFAKLENGGLEVAAVDGLFAGRFDVKTVDLRGADATKQRLRQEAPKARYLHVATHGWFAPEGVTSMLDGAEASSELGLLLSRVEETVRGFAPETLCGLALAGANRGKDESGRVPGILTAEELATLDLSSCELAVLSACETNVGIRRAGQGIQSLQSALHAAGARTAITSLWKVDDAATRRLMELFYTKLWKDGLGKADALWQAKMALREDGHPIRDWAGWVLTGDPD